MSHCKNLRIIYPPKGTIYGKCHYMNNRTNINEYLRIRDAILGLDDKEFVVPNNECPFFNRGYNQTLCPYYNI